MPTAIPMPSASIAGLLGVLLAERVRLSPSSCPRCVRALETAGVIRGYHAELDPAAVDHGFEVTVHVELKLKNRATVEGFETQIAALDEVVECRRMFRLPDHICASPLPTRPPTRPST